MFYWYKKKLHLFKKTNWNIKTPFDKNRIFEEYTPPMSLQPIQMVDLYKQHQPMEHELISLFGELLQKSAFIGGSWVENFSYQLGQYLGVKHVIPCANGTDAIELAIKALDLPIGSEVIVPDFSFVSPAEVVAYLGLRPVFADVSSDTFNVTVSSIASKITEHTKAIIVVHLFGQAADIMAIKKLADERGLYLIEDLAQSFGANVVDGPNMVKAGTIGHVGTTSFFPTKNLACMGDGGAVFSNHTPIAEKIKLYANHGSKNKYQYTLVGRNSRLDTLQAAFLSLKLKYLDASLEKRKVVAQQYKRILGDGIEGIKLPYETCKNMHTFNQFTLKIKNRHTVEQQLKLAQVSFMIYYPYTLSSQPAFSAYQTSAMNLVSETLCQEVLSLPMHPELSEEQQEEICKNIKIALEK
jgi:dTDP-4-amino-4,6-dideoxygalactose transaminase